MIETQSAIDLRRAVGTTCTTRAPPQQSIKRNRSSPVFWTPSGLPTHGGPLPASTSSRSLVLLQWPDGLNHSRLHPSSHQVRMDEGTTKPLSFNSSSRLFSQKSSQSHSPQRLSGVPPLRSPPGSMSPAPSPFLSARDRKSASCFSLSHSPRDGMLQSGSAFVPPPTRTAKMTSLSNSPTQLTAPLSEKLLSLSRSMSMQDTSFSSDCQAVHLIETKFHEAMEKQTEAIRHSIQNALEQQMADLSAQLEHIEVRWNCGAKQGCLEQESPSMSAKRDKKAIGAQCNDQAPHIQHQTSFEDLSVQVKGLPEEGEQGQNGHMSETDRQFAGAAAVPDLEARAALRASANTSTGIDTSNNWDTSNTSTGIDTSNNWDTVFRAANRIRSLDIEPERTTVDSYVGGPSSEVNVYLENAQQFERELNSRFAELQQNLQRLELQFNDLATHIWNEVQDEHQEYCQSLSDLSARLNAAVSALGCRISVQEEELSIVAKAVSHLDIIGSHEDEQTEVPERSILGAHMATPSFGRSFSDSRSSIALQSSEGRLSTGSDFTPNSPLARSRSIGNLHFCAPHSTRSTGSLECRISELAWLTQVRDLKVCPEENERKMSVEIVRDSEGRGGILQSSSRECGNSSMPITSEVTVPSRASGSVEKNDPGIDRGSMEVYANLVARCQLPH